MLESVKTDAVRQCLSEHLAAEYERCVQDVPRPVTELRGEVLAYLEALRERSRRDAFLDLATAERVAVACQALLNRLEQGAGEQEHQAVQAAVAYFVLEDDAEADDSVIGFDDDLQVVEATFRALGWSQADPAE